MIVDEESTTTGAVGVWSNVKTSDPAAGVGNSRELFVGPKMLRGAHAMINSKLNKTIIIEYL